MSSVLVFVLFLSSSMSSVPSILLCALLCSSFFLKGQVSYVNNLTPLGLESKWKAKMEGGAHTERGEMLLKITFEKSSKLVKLDLNLKVVQCVDNILAWHSFSLFWMDRKPLWRSCWENLERRVAFMVNMDCGCHHLVLIGSQRTNLCANIN